MVYSPLRSYLSILRCTAIILIASVTFWIASFSGHSIITLLPDIYISNNLLPCQRFNLEYHRCTHCIEFLSFPHCLPISHWLEFRLNYEMYRTVCQPQYLFNIRFRPEKEMQFGISSPSNIIVFGNSSKILSGPVHFLNNLL